MSTKTRGTLPFPKTGIVLQREPPYDILLQYTGRQGGERSLELSLLLGKHIASLLLILLVGVALVRLKVLKPGQEVVLNKVILYAVTPCSVINAYQMEYSAQRLQSLGIALGGAAFFFLMAFLVSRLLRKPLKLEPVEEAGLIYSNCGNLILPLASALLGREGVFYASSYLLIQTVLIWTHGRSLISGEKGDWKKALLNVNLISVVLGLALFLLRISLPEILMTAVSGMSAMLGPLSMLLLGMMLASSRPAEIFARPRAWLLALLRLVALPAVTLLLLALLGVLGNETARGVLLIPLLQGAAPCAAMVSQFAQLYDKRPDWAGSINVLSTILCVITLPLMAALYALL